MAHASDKQHPIVPREKLDFGLDDPSIPKYWFGGDAFKTRFFDAMSLIFPPGEKFFMVTVRDFRDQVNDPKLLKDIKDFNRQEAQHSMVHEQYNNVLRKQGMPVDKLIGWLDQLLFDKYRNRHSREYTLAITGALEHFTALGAHAMFDDRDIMGDAHPKVRAMYAWHAIEEVEHKGVAYDVMIDYAKVGYFKRCGALIHATFMFPHVILKFANAMLKADGFSFWQRLQLNAKGIWWLLKPGGFAAPLHKHYVQYYKPGYHPWQETEQPGYEEWLRGFAKHNDPVEASELMRADLAAVR
ncbi:MAG: metal-dependent hydrolase [Aquabacterium commune]|jgi:predicted metal-dependent hydrolase|uniref:metal-dependent hydrolase n=1 Tax=Aquabacterium TaxID=92793 RepID=UPI001D3608D2|nr:metal-dependent hydrolase [Aquabacterium sp.]MBT9608587.1 metal-dependent hydrolase [Aquabacterium sp.]